MPNGRPSDRPEVNSLAQLHSVLRSAGRVSALQCLSEDELTAQQVAVRLNKICSRRTTQTVLGILQSLLAAGLITTSPSTQGRVFASRFTETYYLLNAAGELIKEMGIRAEKDPEENHVRYVFSKLASPMKVEMMFELLDHSHCVNELSAILGVSQSTTSEALKILGVWLIRENPQGRQNFYSVQPSLKKAIQNVLSLSSRLNLSIANSNQTNFLSREKAPT